MAVRGVWVLLGVGFLLNMGAWVLLGCKCIDDMCGGVWDLGY